jgi:hypothetical protein
VFILSLNFGPEKVSVSLDQPLLIIDSLRKHIVLVLTMDTIAAILSRLIVPQVNVLKDIWLDIKLIVDRAKA